MKSKQPSWTVRVFSKRYKVGENRGKKRLWIEGKVLHDLGVSRGTRYSRAISSYGPFETLEIEFDNEGSLAVAGTDQRPIIDMCGKWVSDFVNGSSHYQVAFFPANKKRNMARIKIRACVE